MGLCLQILFNVIHNNGLALCQSAGIGNVYGLPIGINLEIIEHGTMTGNIS